MIKGITLQKREIYDNSGTGEVVGYIGANVVIYAKENKYQMLHLINGGWVNAGAKQQYIKWEVVPDTVQPPPPPVVIDPGIPVQPDVPSLVTEVKRMGRIATLLVDWQNPKWGFTSRDVGPLNAYPQTVTFNAIRNRSKGPRIPLTEQVVSYLTMLNGERIKDGILIPNAGWINKPTEPPTVERITWAANLVIVKETRWNGNVEFSNIFASNCYDQELSGTFFDQDMRLVVHKFNAVTRNRSMIKLARGVDCYTPFMTNPYVNNGDMWICSNYLEMWPALPFALQDGTEIIEYELHGYRIFGRRADGSAVLLRDPGGFKTNWKIKSPEVPV